MITPRIITGRPEDSLGQVPARHASETPDKVTFSRKSHGGWVDITAAEFSKQVDQLAAGLLQAGIAPGDRVGLMSRTRYEWTLCDFALWRMGAVVVPIYETSSAEQAEWILRDSGARAVITETAAHQSLIASAVREIGGIDLVWVIDNGDLDTLESAGSAHPSLQESLAEATAGVNRESLATIIYTSGTTGRPKGCELTHDNFLGLAENTLEDLGEVVQGEGASTLLFLPLAHVFARFVEVLCVVGGARMGHSADIANILDDFGDFQPTFILAVPRVFEKIFNKANEQATADGKGKIFATATDVAIGYSRALDTGKVPLGLRLKHAVFDKLVYTKIRARMGGQVRYAVSGGAPLGERLGHYFRGIGVTILEGYGLTETTAPACVNRPGRVKVGTVGPPLPGVGVRIAEDGEILISGVNVFRRYRGNDEATAESFEGEWFRTGDLGSLDSDGCLRITGRKKEIIVTAGGKNVSPALLEDRLRAHPLISQCMVVGEGKPFIGALVTLDPEMLPGWAANNGLPAGITVAEAKVHPNVLTAVQHAVDDANSAVSKAESIRKFAILDTDFTEDNGALTPSLKLRRAVVSRTFADDIEKLFS